MDELREKIFKLSDAERMQLAEEIWDSLESHTSELTDEQKREYDRRMEQYRKDPTRIMSWQEVMDSFRKRA